MSLDGAVVTTQPQCGDGDFPAGLDNIPLSLYPASKPWNVKTGDMQANLAANSYAALGGVGAGGPVTQADLLILRTNAGFTVRLTLADASQPVLFVEGTLLLEPQAGKEVTLVEVIGTGVVEYFASGAQ